MPGRPSLSRPIPDPVDGTAPLSHLCIRTKPLRSSLLIYIATLIIAVVSCYYVHQALLNLNPIIADFWLSAPNANLFVTIISLVISALVAYLLSDALDQLRWALAARNSGVAMPILAILSAATELRPALLNMVQNVRSPIAVAGGLLRLGLPLSSIFFGSILKFGANFDYYFQRELPAVPVYAGHSVLDQRVLDLIHPSRINMYAQTLTNRLLNDDQFAVGMAAPNCEDADCASFFLPGGQGTVRVVGPTLNITLMNGRRLGDSDTIQVQNAPGRLLVFTRLSPEDDFDRDNDCIVYGRGGDDSIQICIRQDGPSLAVGWAACPSKLHDNDQRLCFTETDWMVAPMRTKILMTVYKQFSTTVYKRADSTIADVTLTSEPDLIPLNISDYKLLFERMLVPGSSPARRQRRHQNHDRIVGRSAVSLDNDMINSLTFNLAWLIRLYDDEFPDDLDTPIGYLQNFLAIPVQFMVTCTQFANQTSAERGASGVFPLSGEMQTAAVPGRLVQRMIGQPWAVWLFTTSVILSMVLIGGLYGWIMWEGCELPELVGIPVVDWPEMVYPVVNGGIDSIGERDSDWRRLLEDIRGQSQWNMANEVKKYFARLVRRREATGFRLLVELRRGALQAGDSLELSDRAPLELDNI